MIFITVGTQLHFDRLLKMVESWSILNSDIEIIAQTGDTDYSPQNMQTFKSLPPEQYLEYFGRAEIVIAHAGTGVTLTAARFGVPLIMVPRIPKFGEIRNNHQSEFLSYFKDHPGIYPAHIEAELHDLLNRRDDLEGVKPFKGTANELSAAIRDFIFS